jgi:hypothetical protein
MEKRGNTGKPREGSGTPKISGFNVLRGAKLRKISLHFHPECIESEYLYVVNVQMSKTQYYKDVPK